MYYGGIAMCTHRGVCRVTCGPPILAEQFELKHSLINMITSDQFFGLEKENPHDHIRWFNNITSTIKYNDVPNSTIKLTLFPFSLARAACRTTNLRNEISNFQQRLNESFHEAWDRYKDLLHAYPHHGFTELHQLDTFYNALNLDDQDSLNSATGGNLLERRTQDVLTIIENKSKVRNSRNKSVVSQLKSCDANSNSSSEIAKLTHAVNQQTSVVTTAMTAILKQFQATLPPASVKAVEEICVTCGGAHPDYQCLAVSGNTFPEFRDNIQGYVAAAAVNYNQGNSIYHPPAMANQISPSDFAQPDLQNNQNRFSQPQGYNRGNNFNPEQSYQAPTQQNQGELKSITTRSGIVLDGPFVPIPPPFINLEEDERIEETLTDQDLAEYTIKDVEAKTARKDEVQIHKFWQMFKQLHINITLADALIHMPKYQKMLKALLSNKEKLQELANIPLNENYSAVILKKLLEKLRDPRKFLIPCGFSELKCKALADLGASINLMPLSPSGNLTFSSHPELTSLEVKDDIFDPEGGNVLPEKLLDLDSTKDLHPPLYVNPLNGNTTYFSSPNQLLEEFPDELALITFPREYNDDLQFDIESDLKEIEYLLYHDPINDIDSSLKDSINQSNLADLNDNLVDSMLEIFTDEHAHNYSSPSLYDEYDDDLFEVDSDSENVYDDPFDSKGEKIKESKLDVDTILTTFVLEKLDVNAMNYSSWDAEWTKIDFIIRSWIFSTLAPSLRKHLVDLNPTTAKDALTYIAIESIVSVLNDLGSPLAMLMLLLSRLRVYLPPMKRSLPLLLVGNPFLISKRARRGPSLEKVNNPCWSFTKGSYRFGNACKYLHNGVHDKSTLYPRTSGSASSVPDVTRSDLDMLQSLLAKFGLNAPNTSTPSPSVTYTVSVPPGLPNGDDTVFLLLYVDDIVLTALSDRLLQQIIVSSHREFSMTDLGALNYFLGISVMRDSSDMFLSQHKYAIEILKRAYMVGCNPSRTPVDTESKLEGGGTPVVDPPYTGVCLYMHDPHEPHFSALKRILRYVQGTLDYGLHLFSSTTDSLIAYSDADWAGCPTIAEAEYRGVANAVAETCWIQNLLRELHTPLSSATITNDDNDVDDNFPDKTLMEITTKDIPWFADFANYLVGEIAPKGMTYQQKNKFFSDLKNYFWEDPYLFTVCSDGMIRRCVSGPKTRTILDQCHYRPISRHYGPNTTAKKVLDSGFYWPTIIMEAHTLVRLCEACQKTGNISKRDEMPLNNIQVCKVFDIWAGSESRHPMLNKENYVPWSSHLLRYAKSRPNGKLIHNSILNGPYVRRMIAKPGDGERDINVNETFHEQTDDELSERELKQIEADDQAI
nr:reverse transcriptase domain-containing protein [Tanacetum cinerariifolium]